MFSTFCRSLRCISRTSAYDSNISLSVFMPPNENPNAFASKKILVVEDDRVLRRVIADHLKFEGFSVIEAEDGETGLATALSEHPDVSLLDVVMPKMDGMALLKELREDEWGKQAKVILLTNLNDSEMVSRAMQRGVTDYLVKADWDIQSIVEKVKEKLKS